MMPPHEEVHCNHKDARNMENSFFQGTETEFDINEFANGGAGNNNFEGQPVQAVTNNVAIEGAGNDENNIEGTYWGGWHQE
jgi:hypothetical protein